MRFFILLICTFALLWMSTRQETFFGTDQDVHNHELLVDKVHKVEGGKIPISRKLDFFCKNQIQIRN